uniref:HIT domain-containing protein n=1 Tax=Panagrolaimus sp. ES5 TaxID=591445 RepID=A0AC34F761_9BILA
MAPLKRILCETAKYFVELDCIPFIPGTVNIKSKEPSKDDTFTVLQLPVDNFVDIMLFAKSVAAKLCSSLKVHRCAMIAGVNCNKSPSVKVIPLHGLSAEWNALLAGEPEFNETYQGYISSNNGPKFSDDSLDSLQKQIRHQLTESDEKETSNKFDGDASDTNLFAKLVRGEIPQWRIWEDKKYVAFLTPFPNSPGFSVVIPRKHLSSDIFSLEENDYIELLKASHRVANLLIQGIPNAKSCGLIFEGFEIDYAHSKVIPIIGDPNTVCADTDFCETYKGYISCKPGKQLKEDEIEEMAKKIDLSALKQ